MDDQRPTESLSSAPTMDDTVRPLSNATHSTTSNNPKPKFMRDSFATSTTSLPARKFSPSQPPSAKTSPKPSRETSPIRPPQKPGPSIKRSLPPRSRTNSRSDMSPTRSASTSNPPSAAAVQRALSAASTPALLHSSGSESTIKAPTPSKTPPIGEGRETTKWPVPARLRSPPPQVARPGIISPRRPEDSPAVNVQRPTPEPPSQSHSSTDTEEDDTLLSLGMRPVGRGASGASTTLETVQELSQPTTPASGMDGPNDNPESGKKTSEQENLMDGAFKRPLPLKTHSTIESARNESGSDSGGKSDVKMRAVSTIPLIGKSSSAIAGKSSSAAPPRNKSVGEGSSKHMTVETETVSSIPQVSVGGGTLSANNMGSLRAKPSTETIRPKKEKKKTRKAPSVNQGTGEESILPPRPRPHYHHATRSPSPAASAFPTSPSSIDRLSLSSRDSSSEYQSDSRPINSRSGSVSIWDPNFYSNVSALLTRPPRSASSKADIFEAKIASAVDEANSSDSDETFVYESNPPDTNDRPRRFHSRTPSTTSMVSQMEQRNVSRSMAHGVLESSHGVAPKKSMKFANSYASAAADLAHGEDDGRGSGGSNAGAGRGSTLHHHIGRYGRHPGGNGHPSLFGNESPFPNAAKSKLGTGSRHSSRATSPRVAQARNLGAGKKVSADYDLIDAGAADDEQTPLLSSSPRSIRAARVRRQGPSSIRNQYYRPSDHDRPFTGRFTGFMVLVIFLILVLSGVIGFMFATTTPLKDLHIRSLENVLASQQELIFDIQVAAQNPNVVAINIDSMNVEVFAKSKHLDPDYDWWQRHPNGHRRRKKSALAARRSSSENSTDVAILDDDPHDPYIDDPESIPKILLGKIKEFDSPLTFDGSPFSHTHSVSVGEVHLDKPGNHTDTNGSEQWAVVLKYEFQLILRGVFRYSLPLSNKIKSVRVDGHSTVKPDTTVIRDPKKHRAIGTHWDVLKVEEFEEDEFSLLEEHAMES